MKKAVFGIARTENQAISIAINCRARDFPQTISRFFFRTRGERATLRTSSIRRPPKAQPPALAAVRCSAGRWAGWLGSVH